MRRNILKRGSSILALSLALFASGYASDAFAQDTVSPQTMPNKEEMWRMIMRQQEQIKKLESIVGITNKRIDDTAVKVSQTSARVSETAEKVEATGAAVDQLSMSGGFSKKNATAVGGYAELHYNGGEKDKIDLHRFVVFLSHEFNDRIRFFSEFEIEHNTVEAGAVGAVEVEQAFVEMDLNDNNRINVGLQLIPVGILNETHEPPTFYGVERNNVEKNIIPTTWWEAGIRLSGDLGEDFGYDLMVHSGLDTSGQGYKIRKGRNNVSDAPWKNSAFTARLNWHAIPGIKIGATFQYQDDITQSSGTDQKASATLFEVHTNMKRAVTENGTVGLRALYAQWNVNATAADALGRNIQRGWYLEPSYKIALNDAHAVGFFARYSVWDNEAGDNTDSANKQTNFGINYWPHEEVVLKVDYQIDNFANSSSEDNRINLGLGLQF